MMSANPFFIEGPAVISFSMGRTSARMLRMILDAHGGMLPPDVHVVTSNTGKEKIESLRFGHECCARWGFDWHLVEYRDDEVGFERVGLNSASMVGEPFDALIRRKGYVPNRAAPYCSIELKARVIRDYVRSTWGWQNWNSIVGIRNDEQLRIFSAIGRNHSGKDPWRAVMPLDEAKVVKDDIMRYWLGPNWRRKILARLTVDPSLPQGFDLGLLDDEGNCDLCWKKSRQKRARIIRQDPTVADWWIAQEARPDRRANAHSLFREDESVRALVDSVLASPLLPMDDDTEAEEECGFTCFLADADQLDLAE